MTQAPGNNHRCDDLLESGRRREYLDTCVPLYKASIGGHLEDARGILEGQEYLVRYSITENKETMLHVAATARSKRFVRYLVEMMAKEDLELKNEEGNTAFCLAVIAGNVEMCKIMVEKNNKVMTIRGKENMMPLYLAASHGQYHTVTYLYDHSQRMASNGWTNDDRDSVFLKCIEVDFFDVALKILDDSQARQLPQEKHVRDVLDILARKPYAFANERTNSIQIIVNKATFLVKGSYNSPPKEREAILLLRRIWKKIVEKSKEEIDGILIGPMVKIDGKDTYPSRILFAAAEIGNFQFLVELIREYPDLIWKRNDDGQSIFHIAVFHRHESIYNLLYEIGSMRDTVTQLTDKEGNNMLHFVAMNPGRNSHEHKSGPVFQMQRELIWFQEVRAIIPPLSREMKNAAGQTPFQLFTENHKHLVSEGETWIKKTTSQSLVAAVLICTLGFSAAFTIPKGDYDKKIGVPLFLNSIFMTFVITDAVSFLLSSNSILIFLSIMVSSYTQDEFLEALPKKFLQGQATLFLSITAAMIAFSVSFFVLYQYSILPIIMCILVVIPVILFAKLQSPLLADALRSTYVSKYLFKPKTRILYYQNPRF